MTSIYHTYSFTFSVITVFSSFFILIHIQFLDILPLFHILIHMHSHLMFTLFSSLYLITPMCSHSMLHLYFQQCPHIVTIMSYHHSYAFTFNVLFSSLHFFTHTYSHSLFNAITLFSSLHFITHKYSYSVPYHCSHNFYFISSFTFSAVFISSFICIHPQCHHTVFITLFHYLYSQSVSSHCSHHFHLAFTFSAWSYTISLLIFISLGNFLCHAHK